MNASSVLLDAVMSGDWIEIKFMLWPHVTAKRSPNGKQQL